MSLPSLAQLHLCPVGMHEESSPISKRTRSALAIPVPIRQLWQRARDGVVATLTRAPDMLCLKDTRASSLRAGQQVLDYLKEHRLDGRSAGAVNQYDDAADMRRWEEAERRGVILPVVTAFKSVLTAPIENQLNQVKDRLSFLSLRLASELQASRFLGNPLNRENNLGWTVTYTDRYGDPSNFYFHTDMPPQGRRVHLPPGAMGGDWAMVTMVYYILDPQAELLAKDRRGQGSTLYNQQGAMYPDADTEVAFCPLENGMITIFDGTKWHAVGPNYGVARGAVIHKFVLHKPEHTSRRWGHGDWWKEIQRVLLEIACPGTEGFSLFQNDQMRLCDAVQPPAGEAGPSNA